MKIKNREEAILELENEFKNRTNYIIELLGEKPELENEFKDKVLRKIAFFISFFDVEFFQKNSNERKVFTSYV